MDKVKFSYKPKILEGVFAFCVFSFLAIMIMYEAIISDSGIVGGDIINSYQLARKIVFSAAAVAFIIVSFLMIRVLYRATNILQEIILDDTEISCPKNMISNTIVKIKYKDIESIQIDALGKQLSIVILSKNQRLIISEVVLKNREVFTKLFSLIKEKAEESR